MRDRVARAIAEDPFGDFSDDAIGAVLGVTAAAVQYHRTLLGLPTAQARRRDAPGARVARCFCGSVRLARPGQRTELCTRCGARVIVSVNP